MNALIFQNYDSSRFKVFHYHILGLVMIYIYIFFSHQVNEPTYGFPMMYLVHIRYFMYKFIRFRLYLQGKILSFITFISISCPRNSIAFENPIEAFIIYSNQCIHI